MRYYTVDIIMIVIAIPIFSFNDHAKYKRAFTPKYWKKILFIRNILCISQALIIKLWLFEVVTKKMSLKEILIRKNSRLNRYCVVEDGRQQQQWAKEKMNRLSMMRKGKEKRVEFATKEHTEKKKFMPKLSRFSLRCCFLQLDNKITSSSICYTRSIWETKNFCGVESKKHFLGKYIL